MMHLKEDVTGWIMSEHGIPSSRLTIIEQIEDHIQPNGIHRPMCRCKCSCGSNKEVIAVVYDVKNGHTLSCGCIQKESLKLVHKQNKRYNDYDLSGEYGIGWTRNTKEEFYFDLEDYDRIKDYAWNATKRKNTQYKDLKANDSKTNSAISMHQLLGYKGYDHINRNTFDNRKSNLRQASAADNSRNRSIPKNNTSGFAGVHKSSQYNRWIAQITVDKKVKYLGSFINKNDAIIARLKAEAKYYGDFAPQRHLFEQYKINLEDGEN